MKQPMINKDRKKLRSLQDRVIKKLEKQGLQDNSIVFTDRAQVTLKNLKDYLYPGWENNLKQFLSE
jgi:hypothetical protein